MPSVYKLMGLQGKGGDSVAKEAAEINSVTGAKMRIDELSCCAYVLTLHGERRGNL